MFIIKRDGSEAIFEKSKIVKAIEGANNEVPVVNQLTDEKINEIALYIENYAKETKHTLNVEEIQDLVEDQINLTQNFILGRVYSQYRFKRAMLRKSNSTDEAIISLIDFKNEEVKQENSNKNPQINSVQRDYMAGEVSKDISKRFLLPEDIIKAHDDGIIHFHDLDYFAQKMNNCCLVNLEDMLQNGTVISNVKIDKPKSFQVACTVTTQIIAQVSSSQYGGQSITLAHLAPFVECSRQKIKERQLKIFGVKSFDELNDEQKMIYENAVKCELGDEIRNGIQTIQYQCITLQTTNGQAPFITLFMYINEVEDQQTKEDLVLIINEILEQRYKGIKNEQGVYVTPAFPKLIYVLDENNAYPDSEYFWLTEKAARCTSKRLVPDYISAKKMKEIKEGNIFPCMGCRSFLSVKDNILTEDGKHKFYGRFNMGVVTINLPDVALSSGKDEDKFWEILNERLELCHKALKYRYQRLKEAPSDVAPILWQYGALSRLKKGETIGKLLTDGYATISLGYAGLYETCLYMKGKSHTDPTAKPFALKVMQRLNDACAEWEKLDNLAYSVYGTPIESTTYKFSKAIQKRFGIIPNITDHGYITNSYHVNVRENIDAFTKLKFESDFQKLSPGGCISYIEAPDLQNNLEALIQVMQFIYENIMYAEINIKSDYCQNCGYDGEIKIIEDDNHKLIWECPNCGNRNQNTMNIARRTCGYIGLNGWNQGRTQEIKERVVHLDNKEYKE